MEEACSRAEGPSQRNQAALDRDATQIVQSSAQLLRATQTVEGIEKEQEDLLKTDPRAKMDMPQSDDILDQSNKERTSNEAQPQEALTEPMHHRSQDGILEAGTQQGEQSEEEDDEDDVDFNPLFLREDHDEEEEGEEESEEEVAEDPPMPLQALLEPQDSAPTGLPLLLHSPGGRPPIHPLGPFSPPGQSAFHPFGAPLSFSPGKAKMPHNGSLDLPESVQGPHKRHLEPPDLIQGPQEEGGSANEEGLEAVDGPAKRTRAQVSLAELTMEELETFLQDDEDDFFPDIDDDEEYARFLASISELEDLPAGENKEAGGPGEGDEEEDDDDHDFVAEEEPEEEEEDAQVLDRKRKVGRPRGSRKQKPPSAAARLQRVVAASRRPLAIKPASLAGRYQQVVCHVASKDGRPRPVLMLKPLGLPAPALTPPSVPKFTANQVGQLYCQLHEHVQLLVQLYAVTCLGPPASRPLAAQCAAQLETLASTRERILQDKKTAFPDRCFQPPCARPSVHLETVRGGVAQWAPAVNGPVRSLLDLRPLERVAEFLRDMKLVVAEMDRKFPSEPGQSTPKARLKPLFPPNPDARPTNKPSQTIRSILTNQHNPSPLTRESLEQSVIPQFPAAPPLQDSDAAPGFHFVLLAEPEANTLPDKPLRSLFFDGGSGTAAEASPGGENAPDVEQHALTKSKELVPRGSRSMEGGVQEDLLKAARPTMAPMALVAPVVSDLVREKFQDCFNPALFPKEPQPSPRLKLFTDAEDELLALGMQEYDRDWERIRLRFLPTKTAQQIAVRVKNRCSHLAPDNAIKQVRDRKIAPLSPQEKFLLDEAVLHHGYDWLQLAAYVPRADASLLPKLYREACGVKSKTWKASHDRNQRRRKFRQLTAKQRAKQEAALELRDLDTGAPPVQGDSDNSETDSDPSAKSGAGSDAPEVRGLFLAGEEAPQQGAPGGVFQQQLVPPAAGQPSASPAVVVQSKESAPPSGVVQGATSSARPFSMTGMVGKQPPAKRRKEGPVPSGSASLLPATRAPVPLTRPPPATQAVPFIGARPNVASQVDPEPAQALSEPPMSPLVQAVDIPPQLNPAPQGPPAATPVGARPSSSNSTEHVPAQALSQPPRPPVIPPTNIRPQLNPLPQGPPQSPSGRTVVIRPQARRAMPLSGVAQSNGGVSAQAPIRAAAVPSEAPLSVPRPLETLQNAPLRPGQGPQQNKPPESSTPDDPTLEAPLSGPQPVESLQNGRLRPGQGPQHTNSSNSAQNAGRSGGNGTAASELSHEITRSAGGVPLSQETLPQATVSTKVTISPKGASRVEAGSNQKSASTIKDEVNPKPAVPSEGGIDLEAALSTVSIEPPLAISEPVSLQATPVSSVNRPAPEISSASIVARSDAKEKQQSVIEDTIAGLAEATTSAGASTGVETSEHANSMEKTAPQAVPVISQPHPLKGPIHTVSPVAKVAPPVSATPPGTAPVDTPPVAQTAPPASQVSSSTVPVNNPPIAEAAPQPLPHIAPIHTAPPSPKPWKTRQRQPKGLKAQQKAKEAEERKRKYELKRAEKKKGEKRAHSEAASESAGAEDRPSQRTRGPPPKKRPPKVTVRKLPAGGVNGLLPGGSVNGPLPNGVSRVVHISTGGSWQRGPGPPPGRPNSLSGPRMVTGIPLHLPASRAPLPTFQAGQRRRALFPAQSRQLAPIGAARIGIPGGFSRGMDLQNGQPRGSAVHAPSAVSGPGAAFPWPGQSLQQPRAPLGALPWRGAQSGWQAGSWEGGGTEGGRGAISSYGDRRDGGNRDGNGDSGSGRELPVMERDELSDSDEEDQFEHDNVLDPEDEQHLAGGGVAAAANGGAAQGHNTGEGGGPYAGLGAGGGAVQRNKVEMEQDELTDSDEEEERTSERVTAHLDAPGGGEAELREMERDELTDSDEEIGGGGEAAAQDVIHGFLMEQDELTESDEERG